MNDQLEQTTKYSPACLSPEHNPPTQIYLTPGEYEYTCPLCGYITTFTVPYVGF